MRDKIMLYKNISCYISNNINGLGLAQKIKIHFLPSDDASSKLAPSKIRGNYFDS